MNFFVLEAFPEEVIETTEFNQFKSCIKDLVNDCPLAPRKYEIIHCDWDYEQRNAGKKITKKKKSFSFSVMVKKTYYTAKNKC